MSQNDQSALNEKLAHVASFRNHTTYITDVPGTEVEELGNSRFVYVPALQILLCRVLDCGKVVNGEQAVTHLKSHPNWDRNAAIPLQARVKKLTVRHREVLQSGVSHDEIYISQLPVNIDGHKCRVCSFTNPNRKKTRMHFNQQHPELVTTPLTGTKHVKTENVIDNVPLQELSGFGNNAKVTFIPRLPAQPSTPEPEVSIPAKMENTPRTARFAKTILDAYKQEEMKSKMEDGYTAENLGNARLRNAFVEKSGMREFLSNLGNGGIDKIIELSGSSKDCDLKLKGAAKLEPLEKAIIHLMQLAHDDIPNLSTRLRQLLRAEDRTTPSKNMKDFIRLDNPYSYFKREVKLILFVVRVVLLQDGDEALEYKQVAEKINITREVHDFTMELLEIDAREVYAGDEKLDEAFEMALTALTQALLREVPLAVTQNHIIHDVVIASFFCSCLDKMNLVASADITVYGRMASAYIYNIRLMFIAYYRVREKDEYELEGHTLGDAMEAHIERYLTNDSKNCFETLVVMRPLAMKLARDYKSDAYLIREVDSDVIEYQGARYPLHKLRAMFAGIGAKLEQILVRDLLMIDSLDELGIDYGNIRDDPLMNHEGQSVRNAPGLEKFQDWSIRQLTDRSTRLSKSLVRSLQDGRIAFRLSAVGKYLKALDDFGALLAVAVNLFSGGPLRGTELVLILYKNTKHTKRSLIYNEQHRAFLVTTRYSKTNNTTRKQAINSRFLVPSLSRVVLACIVAVFPLRDYLYKHTQEMVDFSNPYLLAHGEGQVRSESISNRLMRESNAHFTEGFGISGWRRMVNYIIKVKLGYNIFGEGDSSDESEEDLMEDKMANRSTRTSYSRYFSTVSFFSDHGKPQEMTKLAMFSIAYFQFWDLLDEKYHDGRGMSHYVQVKGRGAGDRTVDGLFSLQHEGLRLKLNEMYQTNDRNFLNPEQEMCVQHVVAGTPFLTYISRTGSGKSLAYLLPSYMLSTTMFIVMTPRKSLTEDLIRKATTLKIKTARTEDQLSVGCNLIFAEVADLSRDTLAGLVQAYLKFGKKVTIMLDEVHLLLMEKTYRTCLRLLSSLLKLRANIVFITATMPEPLLRILEGTFHIGSGRNEVVRGSCNRPNICYRRRYFDYRGGETEALIMAMREIEEEDSSVKNKVLVFTNSIKQGEELAEALDVTFVSAGMKDAQQKLDDFVESASDRVLVTTSMAEVGLDIKSVRYTINVEPIYSLMSVAQCSGRIRGSGIAYILCRRPSKAAIDGAGLQSIITQHCANISDFAQLDKAYYKLLTCELTCLRVPMSFFFDGIRHQCLGLDRRCSLCEEREQIKQAAADEQAAEQTDMRLSWLELQEKATLLSNGYCLYCILDPHNIIRPYSHRIAECRIAKNDELYQQSLETVMACCDDMGRGGALLKGHACHGCLFPKNLCSTMTSLVITDGEECVLGDLLKMVIAVMWHWRRGWPMVFRRQLAAAEVDGQAVKSAMRVNDFFELLTRKETDFYDLNTIKLVRVIGAIDALAIYAERVDDDGEVKKKGKKRPRGESVVAA